MQHSKKRRGRSQQRGLALGLLTVLSTAPTMAQRAGQSVSIQYGVVTSAQQVNLKSNAVPGGMLVGDDLPDGFVR